MRQKKIERKTTIHDFIQQYYYDNDQFPSEKDIADGTGIPAASVHRFLVEMRDNEEISYDGNRRSVRTIDLDHISQKQVIPVLGSVACGPGEAEEERFEEYIHMSERLVGKGTFFALVAKGKSMVGEGVNPGDHVIIRRQQAADPGQIVVALLDGKNNLKVLVHENGEYILRSHNDDESEKYPDIVVHDEEELLIQGVAIGVYHRI